MAIENVIGSFICMYLVKEEANREAWKSAFAVAVCCD